MISAATTTAGEKVNIDTGTQGGAVRITVGDGKPFYLTSDEVKKVIDILTRYLRP